MEIGRKPPLDLGMLICASARASWGSIRRMRVMASTLLTSLFSLGLTDPALAKACIWKSANLAAPRCPSIPRYMRSTAWRTSGLHWKCVFSESGVRTPLNLKGHSMSFCCWADSFLGFMTWCISLTAILTSCLWSSSSLKLLASQMSFTYLSTASSVFQFGS